MSDRPCNFCEFERIKRQNPNAVVTTEIDDRWTRVLVDGERLGVWFLELPERCAC